MADYYVYVDPVSGSDTPTGARKSTDPATAAASPWASLAVAEEQERDDLGLLEGSVHFRLLAGQDVTSTPIVLNLTNWPGCSSTFPLYFYGFGSGVHNGDLHDFASGYTLRFTAPSTSAVNVISQTQVGSGFRGVFQDFRVFAEGPTSSTGSVQAFAKSDYTYLILERMLVYVSCGGSAVSAVSMAGSNSGTRGATIRNCVISTNTITGTINWGSSAAADVTNVLFEHNTAINRASGIALRTTAGSGTSMAGFRYNYGHSVSGTGASATIGESGVLNATSDTTGQVQSVPHTTATFTNVTEGSEDYALPLGSSLIGAATSSAVNDDIIGTVRPQGADRDIGAYEYIVSGATHPFTSVTIS